MEQIEVGEYVRTTSGIIDKVDALYGMIENTVHLEKQKWFDVKNILKHSKSVIDLIEVGDVVKVKDNDWIRILDADDEEMLATIIEDIVEKNYKLLSIVTKEQFSQIEYRLEE